MRLAVYFASDMHLRLDRPERAARLARWVDGLAATDEIYLVGDVCDFWFAARQLKGDPFRCRGLKALFDFQARGGALTILPGNHDQWLGTFYEEILGASFVQEPLRVEAFGHRVHLVHGHRVGGRPPWKSGMESRAFLTMFENLPAPVARRFDQMLDNTNDRGRERDERRLIPLFRRYAAGLDSEADVVAFGHVHTPLDDEHVRPRVVILGGWHAQSSYLKLDEQGARLVVERDGVAVST